MLKGRRKSYVCSDIWKNSPIHRNRSDHFAIFWHALLKKQSQQKNQDKEDDKDEVKTLNIEEDFINQVGHFQFNTSPYLGSYKHICIVRSTDPLVVILLNLCQDISQVILTANSNGWAMVQISEELKSHKFCLIL